MKESDRGPFFPKLRVRIKDNTSLHSKFRRFLFPFSSKFPDQNFASYVSYIFSCGTRSEPGLPVARAAAKETTLKGAEITEAKSIFHHTRDDIAYNKVGKVPWPPKWCTSLIRMVNQKF